LLTGDCGIGAVVFRVAPPGPVAAGGVGAAGVEEFEPQLATVKAHSTPAM